MSEEIDIISLSSELGELLKERNYMLATAESCTGGNISATITAVPGSSEYYKGSIIAYSNEVKMNLLQVKEQTLIKHGANSYSNEVKMNLHMR